MTPRTLLAYVCSWCGREYAHAWKRWTGEPVEDSHGVCVECSLRLLRAANREVQA